MDGNRTWAREQGIAQFEWHKKWYDNIENIIDGCLARDVEVASFWALSDDNIRERSALEVKYLFDLLTDGIDKLITQANEKNVRLHFVGDRRLLREDCAAAIERAEIATENNTKMHAVFAIGYGGQEEIARAVCDLAKEGRDMQNITREDIFSCLETGKFPPVELIVRTGWHIRHSGFFLFQSPYAEYFFSEKNWPAFDEAELQKCFESFSERKRKFGK